MYINIGLYEEMRACVCVHDYDKSIYFYMCQFHTFLKGSSGT